MPTPKKPGTRRRSTRRPAARQKPSMPDNTDTAREQASGDKRSPTRPVAPGTPYARVRAGLGRRWQAVCEAVSTVCSRLAGAWRQPATLDPHAIPPAREPWHRRLRHRWRRSRFARNDLPWLLKRLGAYARLTRINKPIGTFLLLWPTLWAVWLASGGYPSPWHFVVFVLGTFLMRSAGCAMNDFADRRIDPHVWRTRERPLAQGELHPGEALALFAVLSFAALGLVLTLNRLALWLALPGAFLAATYPFMKRFTHFPQLYLGMAFGWGIPMAFAAVTGHIPSVAWLLFIVNILWATVYDTMYAMADRPDDLKIGVKSTAIIFGDMDRTIIGILQITVLIGLMLAGLRMHLAAVYYWGLGAAACFGAYEQWLIRKREPMRCFQAFLNNNWFGAAVFAGIILQIPFSR